MRVNVGGLAYGTIATGSVMAVETTTNETYLDTLGAVLVAMTLYWLAHAYATFTQRRSRWLQRRRRPATGSRSSR